jgi:hypothetical protein
VGKLVVAASLRRLACPTVACWSRCALWPPRPTRPRSAAWPASTRTPWGGSALAWSSTDCIQTGIGFREDIPKSGPESQRAVANGQHRGTHPAALGISQQVRPRPVDSRYPVGQDDQLLAAVGADREQDQQAQPLVLQADVDVHTVRPDIDVVHTGQVPGVNGWRSS